MVYSCGGGGGIASLSGARRAWLRLLNHVGGKSFDPRDSEKFTRPSRVILSGVEEPSLRGADGTAGAIPWNDRRPSLVEPRGSSTSLHSAQNDTRGEGLIPCGTTCAGVARGRCVSGCSPVPVAHDLVDVIGVDIDFLGVAGVATHEKVFPLHDDLRHRTATFCSARDRCSP